MCIATVELCNIENRKGVSTDVLLAMLPRALGCASVYAFASAAREDAPMRDVAKILTEEFRFAAKEAADSIMGQS